MSTYAQATGECSDQPTLPSQYRMDQQQKQKSKKKE